MSDVTATSVRLTWSYAPTEREDVTYYVIQYKPKYSNQDYAEISGVLNQDHMITSLNPYTEYEFSVIAFNKVGRGIPSQSVDATTGETSKQSNQCTCCIKNEKFFRMNKFVCTEITDIRKHEICVSHGAIW